MPIPALSRTRCYCATAFAMDFALGATVVAIPFLAMRLGADARQLGLLAAIGFAGYALAAIPSALVSDRADRRTVVRICCVLVAAMLVAIGLARNLTQLYLFSGLRGVFLAPFWPSVFGAFGDEHTGEGLGAATGKINISWSLGSMTGSLVGGFLFAEATWLPFAVSAALAMLPIALMPKQLPRTAHPAPVSRGRRARLALLASGWLGNVSFCLLLGLLISVFPKLAKTEMGVDAPAFGVLSFVCSFVRALVFLVGIHAAARMRDWRFSGAAQILGALGVATIAWTTSVAWLYLVFCLLGLAIGAGYFRGLAISLEHPGGRGLKSGVHEAMLVTGILIGSIGGGEIAAAHGLRSPYVPAACAVVVLVIAQGLLAVISARHTEKETQ